MGFWRMWNVDPPVKLDWKSNYLDRPENPEFERTLCASQGPGVFSISSEKSRAKMLVGCGSREHLHKCRCSDVFWNVLNALKGSEWPEMPTQL